MITLNITAAMVKPTDSYICWDLYYNSSSNNNNNNNNIFIPAALHDASVPAD